MKVLTELADYGLNWSQSLTTHGSIFLGLLQTIERSVCNNGRIVRNGINYDGNLRFDEMYKGNDYIETRKEF